MSKKGASAKAMSKSEITNSLVEKTSLTKKEVNAVLDGLAELISGSLGKKGAGIFNLPGLAKFKVIRKPATKERKGINPFTKEEQIFKAKPARNVVKILPLKALKDQV
ncbi:MAG: HU family DNA-binding protein [Planctomycetaceae bacterium]|nr:HU family DNA-binding protein [Planctomycetaceae bacterium]